MGSSSSFGHRSRASFPLATSSTTRLIRQSTMRTSPLAAPKQPLSLPSLDHTKHPGHSFAQIAISAPGKRRTIDLPNQLKTRISLQSAAMPALLTNNTSSIATISSQVMPIQRQKAKSSITQPTVGASPDIPDLPQTLVTRIQNAKGATARQNALNELLTYLDTAGAVDDISRTVIKYVNQVKVPYAVTKVEGMKDTDKVRITVYANAFNDGPAILYSVIRHELIHVAQRLEVADEPSTGAQKSDPYMYENLYDVGIGPETRDTLQVPLQEVETHAWELLHADETGVSANAKYIADTVSELVRYATTVVQTVKDSAKLPDVAFRYWSGYLEKAVKILEDAALHTKAKTIEDQATKLETAIASRLHASMKPTKKAKKITP